MRQIICEKTVLLFPSAEIHQSWSNTTSQSEKEGLRIAYHSSVHAAS